jgi:hypothetical protein
VGVGKEFSRGERGEEGGRFYRARRRPEPMRIRLAPVRMIVGRKKPASGGSGVGIGVVSKLVGVAGDAVGAWVGVEVGARVGVSSGVMVVVGSDKVGVGGEGVREAPGEEVKAGRSSSARMVKDWVRVVGWPWLS